MISYNKEYFKNNMYFFLKDRGDKISLYYSVADTLLESRKKDEKKEFNKKDEKKLKSIIHKFLNSTKKISKKQIDKELNDVDAEGEMNELIDTDGTFLNSKIPFLDMKQHPRKTMDQTVTMSRVTNDPVTRGYRVYWGESEDEEGNVVSEIDISGTFGGEETQDLNGPETFQKFFKDFELPAEEAAKRTRQQGKEPDARKHKKKLRRVPKEIKNKKNYIDTLTLVERRKLEEERKEKMRKMVEDILAKKSGDDSDVVKKDNPVSKILMNNLKAIKKLAEREGISLNQLMKILKNGE